MSATKLRKAARARGITALYHFTPLANLASILTHGLLSRQDLDDAGLGYTYTDALRLDGQVNGLSLSIHDINRDMFAQKQRQSRAAWVILELHPDPLWTHPCRFCRVNAAASEITRHRGYLGGPWAFDQMFADQPMGPRDSRWWRDVFDTPDNMPTMNDAEVQVLAPIAPDLIRDVTVANARVKSRVAAIMTQAKMQRPIAVVPEAFAC